MTPSFSDDSEAVEADREAELETQVRAEIDQWIERLRRSDRSLYNLMALEVWSIAQTMDAMVPGFWSRFMANRQVALKEFVAHRKKHPPDVPFDPTGAPPRDRDSPPAP